VDGVSFEIQAGRTLCVVGESGCGKSITSLSILRLVPDPPGKIVGGRVLFGGENLLEKKESEMRKIRGNEISMIFQEPMTSLNPLMSVGDQIIEALVLHRRLGRKDAEKRTVELLEQVGIPTPARRLGDYPHQFSGGMRQRVMIAMALSCNPRLLIADEPTTALDVTIQAQIIDLLKDLRGTTGMAMLYITHNLSVVAELADYVAVMYCGKIMEMADVYSLFENPIHPYTVGLLNSLPAPDRKGGRLQPIAGMVPDSRTRVEGCLFGPRCPSCRGDCSRENPPLVDFGGGHYAACWKEA
jgi:oligopeptide/dipeptide ABC transporter ATP-binding protein